MDRRLLGRLDESDVIQEAFLEASQRYDEYQQNPTMPLFLWLRFITGQRLLILHRRHLGTQARDAGREVSLFHRGVPDATSEALAAHLVGNLTSPSQALARIEQRTRVQDAMNSLEPLDREVLALRHFEQMSNVEVSQVLEIAESAASKRYMRALRRLKDLLTNVFDGDQELLP
jgi:RNA polymerase sigma-70 factor (ECF subfamily)